MEIRITHKNNFACNFCYRLLLLVLLLTSCDKALFDAGELQTREIKIDQTITNINIENVFDIILVQDTINTVLVTCGENLQSKISVKVEDNILTLDHSVKNNWSREYERIKLEVHVIIPPFISIHEPVNLKSRGVLRGESFGVLDYGKVSEVDVAVDVNSCGIYMTSDNFGYFKVKGKTKNADIWGWGSAYVRADSLISDNCHVLHRGMADVYVNVVGKLAVSLEFTGDVYYVGNPAEITIEKQISSGKLIKLR